MRSGGTLVGTRARLLAAARAEFAAHGMGGARVGRIAEQAGVNKERIYGYFGSKEQLFAAVVAEALTEHAELLGLPEGDPGEYAGRIYDLHRGNPQLLRLMMWESLHYGTGGLPNARQRAERYRATVDALAAARGSGSEETTGSPATLLALIGIAVLPAAFPQLTRLVLGLPEPGAGSAAGSAAEAGADAEGWDDAELRAGIVTLARRMTAHP
ncbi:TetR family transcriptional regulator [Streptacidiphilus albus]|uniref:TetR family transcriptional regulator n=1 Tax=Streptacidiphilus albus TaxID=105425 RepID=UPI00054C7D33|nr:TetR family transcriptional regulator [Streptacidiphilus albus]